MRSKRFERGVGLIKCDVCGRTARPTEGQTHLCDQCWTLASWDNQYNDDGIVPSDSEMAFFERLLGEIEKLGGNVRAVKNFNNFIWGK